MAERRTFLKLLASSLFTASLTPLTGCTHKKFFNPDEDIILSGGSYKNNDAIQNALIAINLTLQEKRVIETPFLPHDILVNPNNKYSLYCFEKNGTNACEVDLQTQSVKRHFQSTENKKFSGHASFSHDGKELYCVENNTDDNPNNRSGTITIRDSQTLATKKQLSTHGLSAHDCQLLPDNTLVVSNTGKSEPDSQKPTLVYISLETEKLVEQLSATSDNINIDLNNGHFKISQENDLVIASAPLSSQATSHVSSQDNALLGGVSIKKHNSQLLTMSKPETVIKRMTGEALSIEISLRNKITAISHPDANLLTFWSIEKKQILKAFGIEKPRGISQTLDGKNFIVSYGNKAAMAQVSTTELTPVVGSIVQPTLASGEHIINWSRTLREIMPKDLY